MKKSIIGFLLLLIAVNTTVKATPDEGMWLPMFVKEKNYEQMKEMGLKLTPEEIYDINNSSLKDAIVNFGNFCTGEIISHEGLILTNHHCGYEAIQQHSSVEHDYLTDGFWAYNKSEELPNEGLSATFFVNMNDVTEEVLAAVNPEMSEEERANAIKAVKKEIEQRSTEDGKYIAEVKGFFSGNEFFLFIYKEYTDIRLVGAPPSSIGKFGGDTDNWMWPRHTGDFAIFRVYGDADGNPAEYSPENVPLNTPYALPISIEGVKKDDFAMIWGYPGSTDRYRTSEGINVSLNEINPIIYQMGESILDAMKQNMNKSDEVRIAYASQHASFANFWKNKQGESRGLKRLNVFQKKRDIEDELQHWINQDAQRIEKYGDIVNEYNNTWNELTKNASNARSWTTNLLFFGSNYIKFAFQNHHALNSIFDQKLEKNVQTEALEGLRKAAESHFIDYDVQTEKDILISGLQTIKKIVPEEDLPEFYTIIQKKFKGDIVTYVNALFDKSIFTQKDNFEHFINKPRAKTLKKDMSSDIVNGIRGTLIDISAKNKSLNDQMSRNKRLFISALREMNPEKAFYPNANFTMRLTYGSVLDYFPCDAVHYDYITTLEGVMEKEDPSNEEFIVPQKLKDLFNSKDFGRYADENGKLPVCFLSDNDITGGNSGSPVINGNGELIGVAFDGNWEAMSGDIAFEPELQRTISCDIRYVLFIIDKYANAQNLIQEMNIVTPKPRLSTDQNTVIEKIEDTQSEK